MPGSTRYYPGDNSRQNCECVIFVEGADDAYFVSSLLDELRASSERNGIVTVGGSTQFAGHLSAFFKNPNFTQGKNKKIVVILDADNDATAALEDINAALRAAGQPVARLAEVAENDDGVEFAVYVLPDCRGPGDLEALCLTTVQGSALEEAASAYTARAVALAAQNGRQLPGSITKRKAQVYLAGFPIELCRGAGRGFANGAFDRTHSALEPLKEFLRNSVYLSAAAT